MATENIKDSYSNLEEIFSWSDEIDLLSTEDRRQNTDEVYQNPCLATPILKPIQKEISIPPLEKLPKAALSFKTCSKLSLSNDLRYVLNYIPRQSKTLHYLCLYQFELNICKIQCFDWLIFIWIFSCFIK